MALSLNNANGINFHLRLPKLPIADGINDGDILTLNVYETIVPSITVSPIETKYMGAKIFEPGGDIDFDDWSVQFYVDDAWNNWFYLYQWLMYMNNGVDRFVREKNLYAIDADLVITDNHGKEIIVITFRDLYISTLNDAQLSSKDGEENIICGAVFRYQRYNVNKIN